jgi:hypothetical protein
MVITTSSGERYANRSHVLSKGFIALNLVKAAADDNPDDEVSY